MLQIDNDDLMCSYLDQIGIDCEYAIQYIPSRHRNLQGKIVTGFQAVGEIQTNRKFLNSAYCLPIERIAAYGYQDRSLTQELATLSGTQLNHDAFHDCHVVDNVDDPYLGEYVEKDWKIVEREIKVLTELRDFIRGSPYDDSGSPKTLEQYKEWLEKVKEEENV